MTEHPSNNIPEAVRARLNDALRTMGRKHLKPQYRKLWTPQTPTVGYCYVVCEVIHHCLASCKTRPHILKTRPNRTHWFLKLPNGQVIDWTANQFSKQLSYNEARPAAFLTKKMSQRGKILADLLGLRIPL